MLRSALRFRISTLHVRHCSIDAYLQEKLPHATEPIRREIITHLEPVFGRPLTVAHLESFPGLSELAASLTAESNEAIGTTNTLINLLVHDPHGGKPMPVTWRNPTTQSLLHALQDDPATADYLEASCGGNASCCSCHVLVSASRYRLSAIKEEEQDMLDYAAEYDETTSRLACQVFVRSDAAEEEANDPINVRIPGTVNDLWK